MGGHWLLGNQISNNNKPGIELGETWLLGILTGLVLVFLMLSILSKIRPYILCGFWFIALILLYIWRTGYVFLLFPSFGDSTYAGIYIFVLQSIPLILFLIITKVITVLQARDYVVFSKVFSAAIWLSIAYLSIVIFLSLINAPFVVANLPIAQGIFWVILSLDGLLFLVWLIFSSRKNYKFLQFQATFGLLFVVSLVGKIYVNSTNSPSTYLNPKYILWGVAAQLTFIYWLFLKELFKNWESEGNLNLEIENSERTISTEPETIKTKNELLADLSSREHDILLAYCNGFSYTDISSSYFISPNTVKTHLKSCYRKLEINSKVEAINLVNEMNTWEN